MAATPLTHPTSAGAGPQTSVMAILKVGTADLHETVERRMDLGRMTGSLSNFRRTLRAFYGFYSAIESCIAVAPTDGFEFVPEPKTPRLVADLKAVGEIDDGQLTCCQELPRIDSTPRLVGALYVLEGASLGGRIISRMLRDRLGVTPETGGRFFHGSGDQTGSRWQDFGRAAEAAVNSEADIADAVQAARETFAAFDRWMALFESRDGEETS